MNLKEFKEEIEASLEGFIEYVKNEEPSFKKGDEEHLEITLHEGKFDIHLDRPDYNFSYNREHFVSDAGISKMYLGGAVENKK
jgi:hypothetical protein